MSNTNKFQVTGENLLNLKKSSPPDKVQESETNQKALRNLQLIFQMNLNKFIRKNKDAFGGLIEVPVNRPILTKEQYQNSKKVLENIDDYMERLVKGMIARNNYLEKELKSFDERYREVWGTPSVQNPQQNPKQQPDQQKQSSVLMVYEDSWQGYDSKTHLIKYRTTSDVRPFSATLSMQRNQKVKKLSLTRLTDRPLSSQLSREVRQRNPIQIKSINLHNTKIDKDSKKVPLFRQNFGLMEDYEKYVQEEVYIRKKIVSQIGQNSILRAGSAYYSKRDEKPSLIQRFKNAACVGQMMNESEKQKLQSKIMMVNTVLAFNLNQTQGYRPKSKVWSNRFI